jgi:hypothetical protein
VTPTQLASAPERPSRLTKAASRPSERSSELTCAAPVPEMSDVAGRHVVQQLMRSPGPAPGAPRDAAGAISPSTIIGLQRTAGNRAVQRLLAGPPACSVPGHRHGHGPVVQRRIVPDARVAIEAAAGVNHAFDALSASVDRLMPEDAQKKLIDVESTGAKISSAFSSFKSKVTGKAPGADPGRGNLVHFMRAWLLSEFGQRLEALEAKNLPPAEKKKSQARYLAKALEVRDKHAPLLKKGTAAPETQAFLASIGLDAGVPVAAEDKAKEVAKGPRIDVRSTFLGGRILGISLRGHLFVVYTTSEGRQLYFRGGPGEDVPGLDAGYTTVDAGDYTPGTIDWDPSAPSTTVMKGPQAAEKLDGLLEAGRAVNAMQVPYQGYFMKKSNLKSGRSPLTGENCNAAAWTLLNRAGVPTSKPGGLHPGWGHVLGADSGQGNPAPEREKDTLDFRGKTVGSPSAVFRDRLLREKQSDVPKLTDVQIVSTDGDGADEVYKVAYDHEVEHKIGWMAKAEVLSAGLHGRDHPLPPVPVPPKASMADPAIYPAGRHNLVGKLEAPLELHVSSTEDGPLATDITIAPDYRGVARLLVLDDTTRNSGRAQLQYDGKAYYVPLDQVAAVFGWAGAPKPEVHPIGPEAHDEPVVVAVNGTKAPLTLYYDAAHKESDKWGEVPAGTEKTDLNEGIESNGDWIEVVYLGTFFWVSKEQWAAAMG